MFSETDLRDALQWKAEAAAPLSFTSPTETSPGPARNRHRAVAMLATAAAVLALASGAGLVSERNHSSAPEPGPASGSASVTATPQTTATTLASLTASYGTLTNVAGHGGSNYTADTMELSDASGQTFLFVNLVWPAAPNDRSGVIPQGCQSVVALAPTTGDIHWANVPQTCSLRSDGTQVSSGQGSLPAADGQEFGLAVNTVSVLRPDGIEVTMGSANAASIFASTSGASAPNRAAPALSLNDLTQIATSPSWTSTVTSKAAKAANERFPALTDGKPHH